MSFGEFLISFFESLVGGMSWFVVSALLAAVVIFGSICLCIPVGFAVSDRWHWGWNFITIPAILGAGFVLVMLLAWSAFGSGVL